VSPFAPGVALACGPCPSHGRVGLGATPGNSMALLGNKKATACPLPAANDRKQPQRKVAEIGAFSDQIAKSPISRKPPQRIQTFLSPETGVRIPVAVWPYWREPGCPPLQGRPGLSPLRTRSTPALSGVPDSRCGRSRRGDGRRRTPHAAHRDRRWRVIRRGRAGRRGSPGRRRGRRRCCRVVSLRSGRVPTAPRRARS